ncbi:MAG: ABC transporter ATP-binding protein [Gammaproteobacteria bacterium]
MPTAPKPSIIELRDLTKAYHEGGSERVVLQGVNAAFSPGRILAVTGRSGSGKSTLLNLISGIDLPTSGGVRFDKIWLHALDDTQRTLFRRRHIGFVFQFYNLIPTLTVEENLLLPLELNGTTGYRARTKAMEFLERLGLDGRGSSFPDRLSGGEQQRVAIARALIHDPAVILADEPTGNLDLETGHSILNLLQDTVRGTGKTLILVTHSPEVVAVADCVYSLGEGRLTVSAS